MSHRIMGGGASIVTSPTPPRRSKHVPIVHLADGSKLVIDDSATADGGVSWRHGAPDGELLDMGTSQNVDAAIAHAKGEAWTDADREIALVAFQLPQVAKALRAILAEVRER